MFRNMWWSDIMSCLLTSRNLISHLICAMCAAEYTTQNFTNLLIYKKTETARQRVTELKLKFSPFPPLLLAIPFRMISASSSLHWDEQANVLFLFFFKPVSQGCVPFDWLCEHSEAAHCSRMLMWLPSALKMRNCCNVALQGSAASYRSNLFFKGFFCIIALTNVSKYHGHHSRHTQILSF